MRIYAPIEGKEEAVIFLDKKDFAAFIGILDAAITNKKLSKRSNAMKLAQKLDDELPVY